MSGYVKWTAKPTSERAGGIEEAERRRKALMARQRPPARRGTQAPWPYPGQLAEAMGVTPDLRHARTPQVQAPCRTHWVASLAAVE